jgi:hypothetical protein
MNSVEIITATIDVTMNVESVDFIHNNRPIGAGVAEATIL